MLYGHHVLFLRALCGKPFVPFVVNHCALSGYLPRPSREKQIKLQSLAVCVNIPTPHQAFVFLPYPAYL
jgi:hypothetical protein